VEGSFEIVVNPMPANAASAKPYEGAFNFAVGGWMCGRSFGAGETASSGGFSAAWRAFLGEAEGRSPAAQKVDGVFPVGAGEVLPLALRIARAGKAAEEEGGSGAKSLAPLEKPSLAVQLECVKDSIGLRERVGSHVSHKAATLFAEQGFPSLLPFDVECKADAQTFAMLPLRISLVLRAQAGHAPTDESLVTSGGGTVLQSWSITVKPSLKYAPKEVPGDVLLFAGGFMDSEEINAWQRLLAGLGLTYDVWDVSGNFGISKDRRNGAVSAWVGRHNSSLLVAACNNDESAELLEVADVVNHLGKSSTAEAIRAAAATKEKLALAETTPKTVAAAPVAAAAAGEEDGEKEMLPIARAPSELNDLAKPQKPAPEASAPPAADDDDDEGAALGVEALHAPPPNHASVLFFGTGATRLTNRFFNSTVGANVTALAVDSKAPAMIPEERFVVSTAIASLALDAAKKTEAHLFDLDPSHMGVAVTEFDLLAKANSLLTTYATKQKDARGWRWRFDPYRVPRELKHAKPVSLFGTALKMVRGGVDEAAFSLGKPLCLRPFPLPTGAKLSALPALGMVRYRAAPAPTPLSCLPALCAGGGRPAEYANSHVASLSEELVAGQARAKWLPAKEHSDLKAACKALRPEEDESSNNGGGDDEGKITTEDMLAAEQQSRINSPQYDDQRLGFDPIDFNFYDPDGAAVVDVEDMGLSREPPLMTTAPIPGMSRFAQVSACIVSALSVEKKARLLVDSTRSKTTATKADAAATTEGPACANWSLNVELLGAGAAPVQFSDMVLAALYAELKTEFGAPGEDHDALPLCSRMVAWCLSRADVRVVGEADPRTEGAAAAAASGSGGSGGEAGEGGGEAAVQLNPYGAAALWSVLLRLMRSTRGVSNIAASRAVAKMLTLQTTEQKRRDRLVVLHRALKTHVLGGFAGSNSYSDIKKRYPAKYSGLRHMAEAASVARFKLRYIVPHLQEPALEECRIEAEERVRFEHVLYWKTDISTGEVDSNGLRKDKTSIKQQMRRDAYFKALNSPVGNVADSASVAYAGARKTLVGAITGKKSEKK